MSGWSHPVAAFWAGEDLSFVEQMVIRSYLDQGCDFTLYLAHPVGGIPEGTPVRDATEITPKPNFLSPEPTRKQLALWSDFFRIRLMQQQRAIYVDLDAYCLKPYDLPDGYGFGLDGKGGVLCGVLALPQHSAALRWMLDFISRDEIRPPWADPGWVERRARAGLLGPADMPWGYLGPHLLTYALRQSGEDRHALPKEVFYPVTEQALERLCRSGLPDAQIYTPDSLSVHIFGFTKRVLATYWQGLPPAGSWLARMAARHGIDPAGAPATGLPLPPARPPRAI